MEIYLGIEIYLHSICCEISPYTYIYLLRTYGNYLHSTEIYMLSNEIYLHRISTTQLALTVFRRYARLVTFWLHSHILCITIYIWLYFALIYCSRLGQSSKYPFIGSNSTTPSGAKVVGAMSARLLAWQRWAALRSLDRSRIVQPRFQVSVRVGDLEMYKRWTRKTFLWLFYFEKGTYN